MSYKSLNPYGHFPPRRHRNTNSEGKKIGKLPLFINLSNNISVCPACSTPKDQHASTNSLTTITLCHQDGERCRKESRENFPNLADLNSPALRKLAIRVTKATGHLASVSPPSLFSLSLFLCVCHSIFVE